MPAAQGSVYKPTFFLPIYVTFMKSTQQDSIDRLNELKNAKTKSDLADILGIPPSFLTRVLYVEGTQNQYVQFSITKRSGGTRTISAPSIELKDIQSKLSKLLLDCNDALNFLEGRKGGISHGFERKKSIISNAEKHKNQKNVLNLDLEDFFGTVNFGRIRGYFIKNKDFALNSDVATTIAHIACYDRKLPQGSPCSPVIANLIARILDVRLVKVAKKYGCTYTRYADDITFSTRKKVFPSSIVESVNDKDVVLGTSITREIRKCDFKINHKKTRVQFKDSRQDVTGLIVNKKVNIKREYWRDARSKCHKLFTDGEFFTKNSNGDKVVGKIKELEGTLTFIDSVDEYNNKRPKGYEKPVFQKIHKQKHYRIKLNVRERTYSEFLYYKWFCANETPTILTEGKTDVVYLKAALSQLASDYPMLAKSEPYKPQINFFGCSGKTNYLLNLDGGAAHFIDFVNSYELNASMYKNIKKTSPVIVVLDNDTGPVNLLNQLKGKYGLPQTVDEIRKSNFLHIKSNLYLILTPLNGSSKTDMEDMFEDHVLNAEVKGKKFNKSNNINTSKEYGKHIFSLKVVQARKSKISFAGFCPIFDAINNVINHYDQMKS